MATIRYVLNGPVNEARLAALFRVSWPGEPPASSATRLEHSLAYVCAYDGPLLTGFVNLAWDGGLHAFILDTTVHPEYRRSGIGSALVRHAAAVAREAGCHWVHVDYEPRLAPFYQACGFAPTTAGLMRLG